MTKCTCQIERGEQISVLPAGRKGRDVYFIFWLENYEHNQHFKKCVTHIFVTCPKC